MERPLKGFDYSKYPNMPQNRVAFEDLEVGASYEALIIRPGGKQLVTYLGDGQYQCGNAVYSDWELDQAMSLVIPIQKVDDKINPFWERPSNWKYEEDWGSAAWQRRMRQLDSEVMQRREQFGFQICPKCSTVHTTKTLSCRNCGYKSV